jgi:hypothetical protein
MYFLENISRLNKLDGDSLRTALKQAYVEVEGETLKNPGDRDLLIIAALNQIMITTGRISNFQRQAIFSSEE